MELSLAIPVRRLIHLEGTSLFSPLPFLSRPHATLAKAEHMSTNNEQPKATCLDCVGKAKRKSTKCEQPMATCLNCVAHIAPHGMIVVTTGNDCCGWSMSLWESCSFGLALQPLLSSLSSSSSRGLRATWPNRFPITRETIRPKPLNMISCIRTTYLITHAP